MKTDAMLTKIESMAISESERLSKKMAASNREDELLVFLEEDNAYRNEVQRFKKFVGPSYSLKGGRYSEDTLANEFHTSMQGELTKTIDAIRAIQKRVGKNSLVQM